MSIVSRGVEDERSSAVANRFANAVEETGRHGRTRTDATSTRCRNLWGFLESRKGPDDDIIADHHINGWRPQETLGKYLRIAINKHLAHMSYNEPSDKPWEIGGYDALSTRSLRRVSECPTG